MGGAESSPQMRESFRLLESAQAGEERAADDLFRLYLPHLRRWAHGRLPSWARRCVDTEDLVQDVMRRTLQNLPKIEYRRAGGFQAYLREALRNKVRDEVRKAARGPDPETLEEGPDTAPSPLEELIGKDALRRYEEALSRLQPLDREAIVARLELGLSYAEVAQCLEKPSAAAARMSVSRAVVRLVKEMSSGA